MAHKCQLNEAHNSIVISKPITISELVISSSPFWVVNKFTTALNCLKYQSYKCSVSVFTHVGQHIEANGEHNCNVSIEKPATRKVKSLKP